MTAFDKQVEAWRPLVAAMAGDIPVDFLLAWIQRESGGNPCSYTSLRESGIFQLMPPDNTNTGGTTEAALRPACSGQSMTRAFTSPEVAEQVRSGIKYVRAMMQVARDKLAAAGVAWNESSPDFWKVVKLQHAYPAPTLGWLQAATAALGHPPRTWDEFRAAVPSARADVLDNAEWVGAYGVGGGGGSFIAKLAIAGAAAWVVLKVFRGKKK